MSRPNSFASSCLRQRSLNSQNSRYAEVSATWETFHFLVRLERARRASHTHATKQINGRVRTAAHQASLVRSRRRLPAFGFTDYLSALWVWSYAHNLLGEPPESLPDPKNILRLVTPDVDGRFSGRAIQGTVPRYIDRVQTTGRSPSLRFHFTVNGKMNARRSVGTSMQTPFSTS